MNRHVALPWPEGSPHRLELVADKLAALADQVSNAAASWATPHARSTWRGTASQRNARRIAEIHDGCVALVAPIRRAAELTRRLAVALGDAQQQIGRLGELVERAEHEARLSAARAQRAREESQNPLDHAAIHAVAVLESHAHQLETERRAVLAGAIRRATSIIADFDAVDRATAASIDSLAIGTTTTPPVDASMTLRSFGTRPGVLPMSMQRSTRRSRGRQYLEFDAGGDGTIVEVFGDMSMAEHIAVVVPGVMNTKDTFDTMVSERARWLYETSIELDPSVAVVAWLGYDTPEVFNGISKRRARQEEHRLRAFLEHLPRAHVTVVAHSYGSVLTGEAALTGLEADELVLIGSPGTSLDTVDDANLRPDARIWAGIADTDLIGRTGWGSVLCPEVVGGIAASLPWKLSGHPATSLSESCQTDTDGDVLRLSHGINPAHADFGAVEIPTDGVRGHSSYLNAGTTSIEAIAEIVTDRHQAQR